MTNPKAATKHHRKMTRSSYILLPLVPLFLYAVGSVIGSDYATVQAHFAKPFPALITALMLIVGMDHFRGGVTVLLEDYLQGWTRKLSIVAMIGVSYGLMAIGLYAIALLAF